MKMADGTNLTGGFTAFNSGSIKDCYCLFNKRKRNTPACFTEKNNGNIQTSFAKDRKNFFEQWNGKGMLTGNRIRKKADAVSFGYDFDKTWTYDDEDGLLRFNDDNWFKKISIPSEKRKFTIRSAGELLRFIDLVNKGDSRAVNSYVCLERDIDLNGKSIDPIGNTRKNAFKGIFDGNGHSVKNFRIKDKDVTYLGFFGILKGAVLNLVIDCEVSGEGSIGAVCGVNEGSIYCSGAVVTINGSGDKLRMGGFCGQNMGSIAMCYVAVGMSVVPIPILPICMSVATVFLIGTVAFSFIPATEVANRTFATVETDRNQVRIPDEEKTETPPDKERVLYPDTDEDTQPDDAEKLNEIEFRFNETIHIDRNTGYCYLNFENPSYAQNTMVIYFAAEDEERTIMARSGAVTPGHKLDYLELEDAGYDIINSGVRTGVVVLVAYDSETSEKAMVNTELPVRIVLD